MRAGSHGDRCRASLFGACPFVSPTIKSDAAYSQGDLSPAALGEPVPAVAEASLNGRKAPDMVQYSRSASIMYM